MSILILMKWVSRLVRKLLQVPHQGEVGSEPTPEVAATADVREEEE